MKSRRWRHRLEWGAIRTLAWVIPRLPRRVCLALADGLGGVAAFVHVPGRRVALANVQNALGGAMSRAEQKRVVRESYQYFARAMADLFWSPRLTSENVAEVVDLADVDRFTATGGAERGAIFACLHYGGFEWIAHVLGLAGVPCTVVTNSFKNPLLNPTFNGLRELSGHVTIRREGAMLRLYKALRNGRSVTIAVDLTVPPKLPSVPITSFGMQTCVTFGHVWLQKRTGAPIIPAYCEPLPHGRYKLVLQPPLEMPAGATNQQIAQACWDRFEPVVRQNPSPWLWMYKHWRYRPAQAPRAYPFYANESSWFRVLLARTEEERAAAAANVPRSDAAVGG
ncbi:hypothetical protein BH20VER1_BH20VER1_00310 [soil metagenome]